MLNIRGKQLRHSAENDECVNRNSLILLNSLFLTGSLLSYFLHAPLSNIPHS